MRLIRKLISKIISEAITESVLTKHAKQRIYDRINSEYSTFSHEDENIKEIVKNNINFLEKVDFPGQDNIGVMLFKGPHEYIYRKQTDRKTEQSKGNYIWVIIRGNDIETIVFGGIDYKPKNTQLVLTFKKLKNYIENTKNRNFNLTNNDISQLKSPRKIQQKKQKQHIDDNHPIIIINGVKYVIDIDKSLIYKKNDQNKKYNLFDFIELLDAKTQDLIYQLL